MRKLKASAWNCGGSELHSDRNARGAGSLIAVVVTLLDSSSDALHQHFGRSSVG